MKADPADRRRDRALFFLLGGGVSMTLYAAWALWLVREAPERAFWMGMAALALVGVVLTGFAGLIVRRTLRINRDGLEVSDLAPLAEDRR